MLLPEIRRMRDRVEGWLVCVPTEPLNPSFITLKVFRHMASRLRHREHDEKGKCPNWDIRVVAPVFTGSTLNSEAFKSA